MAALLVDLGLCSYREVYDLQLRLVQRRYLKALKKDVFLVCEHYPVYTFGKHADRSNLHVSDEFLAEKKISLEQIERGGEVTYHCPGQLVLYPIISLRERRLRVAEYIHLLEDLMLRVSAAFAVEACRNSRNAGIWLPSGRAKIGSIGIAVRHGVSFHGMALNINADLTPFSWITPCGLQNVSVETLASVSGVEVSVTEAKLALFKIIEEKFPDVAISDPASLV